MVVFGREFYPPFSALLRFVLAVAVLEVMGILHCRCAKLLEHQAVDWSDERGRVRSCEQVRNCGCDRECVFQKTEVLQHQNVNIYC